MLCIMFCWIKESQLISVELVDQTNISADCHQLILLLSVCLPLDFKQNQEHVKRQPFGAQNAVLIVSLIVDFFL